MSNVSPEIKAIQADLEVFLKKGVAEELDNRKLDETLLTQTKNALKSTPIIVLRRSYPINSKK